MSKDINIHLKTRGAEQTKQQLGEVGKKTQQLGQKTTEGQKQAADATEKASSKMTGMGRILTGLKSQVMGFVGAWLGLQGVQKVITYIIEKLERIQQLQKDIYQNSLNLAEIGQALEFQTGTRGKQQFWTQQAVSLQQAGGLVSPQVAQQMLVSMDIAFGAQGGIKNKQILDLGKQLAPFVGAAGLGPEQVAKVFEFAGTAGIAPTEQGYKQYFTQLQAAYTASKATDFGQFMLGIQRGVTPYMAMGGTLQEGLSTFAGARAVMSNEQLAAMLVEQVARLSGGGYEKPRMAIEKSLGVQWSQLSMDKRTAALLQYVKGIPESQRQQVLAKQGFPVELTSKIGMMVTPEAQQTMESTRKKVASATTNMVDQITDIYLKSVLGKERVSKAKIAEKEVETGPQFADWQTRISEARKDVEIDIAKGQDRWMSDKLEPYVLALEKMRDELKVEGKPPSEGPEKEIYLDIEDAIADINRTFLSIYWYPPSLAARRGYRATERLNTLRGLGPAPIINNYDNRRIFNPVVGVNKEDLGIGPVTPRNLQ